jgi:predicted phosphodiesterase
MEVVDYALEHGDEAARDAFNVNQESLSRYKREYRKLDGDLERRKLVRQMVETFSEKELRAIVRGGAVNPYFTRRVPPIDFDGDKVRLGVMGDTHWGSKFSPPELYHAALDEFRKQGVETIIHVGDVTEGMSNRPGHVYELDQIGYTAQKRYALAMLSEWEGKWYIIDGNHDRWFIKSAGAKVVEELCDELPNATFVGHDSGEIPIGRARLMPWHGEDGNSYAISYRLQKIVEALPGGGKPNVIFAGHTHKAGYFFIRNVHVFSTGSIQLQTDWMRSKRLEAHPGFWIVDLWVNNAGVSRVGQTFYPFYA